jgi:hypothetical protein
MDSQERHYLLGRVLAGHSWFDGYYLNHPTRKEFLESEIVYHEILNEARLAGLFFCSEMQQLLERFNLWHENDNVRLKQLEDKVDDYKVAIYENMSQSKTREIIRAELNNVRNEIDKLKIRYSQWDQYSAESVAGYARFQFLLINNITDFNGNKVYVNDLLNQQVPALNDLSARYHQDQPQEVELRELSHTDPWRNQWSLANSVYETFGKPTLELTNAQMALCLWSRFYDNVLQAHDAPHDSALEDDDIIDGWLIAQRRKRDSELAKREVEARISKNPKIAGAGEIFIVANDLEDARKIHSVNDKLSQMKISQRNKIIQTRGVASQLDFADVRIDLEKKLQESRK